MRRFFFAAVLSALALAGLRAAGDAPLPDGLYAEFDTAHGAVIAELYYRQTPLVCGSFVGLAEGAIAPRNGHPFFTGLRWYRVVPDFVIQSGDPTNPGGGIQDRPPQKPEDEAAGHPYNFPDEIVPGLHHDAAGVLSMANAGPDTNSSEFFITLRDTNRLNYLHSVFGRVVRGVELLSAIKQDEPFSIKILRIGAEAKAFDASEAALKSRMSAARKYGGPAEPGPTAFFDDADKLLPQDVPRAKNFNFKLANYARFGGRTIQARLYAKFVPATPGQTPEDAALVLARQAGAVDEGAIVSYYKDGDRWNLRIGDRWLARFAGHEGTRETLQSDGSLTGAENAFFAEARKRAAETADRLRTQGRTINDSDLLKLTVDEVLDGLILLYEPSKTP
ncbi:MAG TPA: peptidylprolyl isomerase [Candidatus Didemnitutus sp.]|nr:peptidylprolyl isomerase [Candidatus Didemnitutus sp.]